jgi:predicted ArsR family transcriptional regulator
MRASYGASSEWVNIIFEYFFSPPAAGAQVAKIRPGEERTVAKRTQPTTRNAILAMMCHGPRSVSELAAHLDLTENAVRAQIERLQGNGFVQQKGLRRGVRRPHAEYELTAAGRELFPKVYEPVLRELVATLPEEVSPAAMQRLLRRVGQRLLKRHIGRLRGSSPARRLADFMSKLNGSSVGVEVTDEPGRLAVRSCSCPLASITSEHPELCDVAADVFTELLDAKVQQRCERAPTPQCHFEIGPSPHSRSRTR